MKKVFESFSVVDWFYVMTLICLMLLALIAISQLPVTRAKEQVPNPCPTERLVIIDNEAYCKIITKKVSK